MARCRSVSNIEGLLDCAMEVASLQQALQAAISGVLPASRLEQQLVA